MFEEIFGNIEWSYLFHTYSRVSSLFYETGIIQYLPDLSFRCVILFCSVISNLCRNYNKWPMLFRQNIKRVLLTCVELDEICTTSNRHFSLIVWLLFLFLWNSIRHRFAAICREYPPLLWSSSMIFQKTRL